MWAGHWSGHPAAQVIASGQSLARLTLVAAHTTPRQKLRACLSRSGLRHLPRRLAPRQKRRAAYLGPAGGAGGGSWNGSPQPLVRQRLQEMPTWAARAPAVQTKPFAACFGGASSPSLVPIPFPGNSRRAVRFHCNLTVLFASPRVLVPGGPSLRGLGSARRRL